MSFSNSHFIVIQPILPATNGLTPMPWSPQRDVALAILTADCVPVLFADLNHGVIGAAHAGWRGANGILDSTITLMCDNGASLSSIEAVIGPAIAKSNYQVRDDCRNAVMSKHPDAIQFFTVDPNAPQKYLFDLPAFTAWQISRIGLTEITDLAVDTYDSANNLFSHRRATHTIARYWPPDCGYWPDHINRLKHNNYRVFHASSVYLFRVNAGRFARSCFIT